MRVCVAGAGRWSPLFASVSAESGLDREDVFRDHAREAPKAAAARFVCRKDRVIDGERGIFDGEDGREDGAAARHILGRRGDERRVQRWRHQAVDFSDRVRRRRRHRRR